MAQDRRSPEAPDRKPAADAGRKREKPGPADPDRRAGNPAVSPQAKRESSTPGEGAGPLKPQGDEVDPGAG